jgi:transposase
MLASDSNEIELGAVRAVCLAASEVRSSRTSPTLPLHKIFNYILRVPHIGCKWKMLPIERNAKGRHEIYYKRIYRLMRRWQADGCMDAIFASCSI